MHITTQVVTLRRTQLLPNNRRTYLYFFFLNDPAPPKIYPLPLHDALPISYEEIKEAFRPESLLPMKLAEPQVRDSIRQWYRTRWFAPNKLKARALTDTVRGLYVPYWTFDEIGRAHV